MVQTQLLLSALAASGLAFGASAGSIGVSFAGDNGGGTSVQITPGQTAGVVAQSNWNAGTGASGSLTNVNDDSGAATTADVDWSSANTWGGTGAATDDAAMVNGWLDDGGAGLVVDVDQIPYAIYDVYVYFSSDTGNENRSSSFLINGTAFSTGGTYQTLQADGTFFDGVTYVNGGTAANDPSYMVISGVSGAHLDIDGNPVAGQVRSGLSGFQIVEVPEPGSLALLGLGGLAVLRRRR